MKNMKTKWYKSLLIFSSFLVLYFPLSVTAVHAEQNYQISYLIDSVKPYEINEISSPSFDKKFLPAASNTLNFGLIDRAVWLKITIPNSVDTQFMELNTGSIQSVKIYSSSIDREVSLQNNLIISDKIDYRSLLFELPSGSTNYIKLKSSGKLFLKYFLSDKKSFFNNSANDYLLIGLFLGFIISFSVYSCINCKAMKDKNNIYYVLFVLSLGLYFSAVSGVWGQYIVGQQYTDVSIHIFTSFFILSALAFTKTFLNTKSKHPNVDLVIKVLFIITLLHLFIGSLTDASFIYEVGHYLEIGVPALILYFCVNSYLQGYKEAWYLVVGWFLYFTSLILTGFMYADILPVSFLTSHAMTFGTAAVIVLLAWALMDKFITEYDCNFASTSKEGGKLVDRIDQLKAEISLKEKDVQHNLDLLEEKDQEIEYAQKRIREQATHDGLTKLINHDSFVLQFQHFFHDATRYHYPVITLLIDVDDFKVLNEKFGLAAGNDVLKAIANIVTQESRNTDLIARYGDDEIVFVMTHAVMENAMKKSEEILLKIQQIKIKDHPDLSVSASIGVTVMGASERSGDYSFILDKVEKAVEQAQDEGGSCVRVFTYDDRHLEI
ncbi:MAG: diguanylate cyclase [Methylococcales bacterium]|nr:diguanylate cyclase [Methylococcales bacterium]